MSRKTWLPVSAQEWAASAAIDAGPETRGAMGLAAATSMFAAKAMSTVSDMGPDLSRFTQFTLLRPSKACQELRYLPGDVPSVQDRRTMNLLRSFVRFGVVRRECWQEAVVAVRGADLAWDSRVRGRKRIAGVDVGARLKLHGQPHCG